MAHCLLGLAYKIKTLQYVSVIWIKQAQFSFHKSCENRRKKTRTK